MKTRRQFIKLTGTGVAAAGLIPVMSAPENTFAPADSRTLFSVGMAGYTFREFNIDQTIEIMKKIAVNDISLKDFHLPMDSTQEKVDDVIGRFRNAGINVYTLGVIYMKTKDAVDLAFEYARKAGVRMIVGAPDYELLPYVESKVKEYDFRLAIHNHGPDNPLFPNATDIWNHVKNLDPRMGICLDIGHNMRDGYDPAVDIRRYGKRLYDVHIKDVDAASKEGKTVEIGRGIINMQSVVTALRKIKYSGRCSLEYEKDMKDPLAGIAESIGYWRGVVSCV